MTKTRPDLHVDQNNFTYPLVSVKVELNDLYQDSLVILTGSFLAFLLEFLNSFFEMSADEGLSTQIY